MNISKAPWAKLFTSVFAMATFVAGVSVAGVALAAPQKVTYQGTAVTTAVPDKAFTVKFRVQNTGDTTYNRVKVVFHIPAGDMSVLGVSPANSIVADDAVTWVDVPIEPGKSFYPTLTLKMAAGTPLKTKMRIWVEVTGEGMEATSTNFSVTAVAATKATTLTSTDITSMFQSVYGRAPSKSELTYWMGRRGDKPMRSLLIGAMTYQKVQGITH